MIAQGCVPVNATLSCVEAPLQIEEPGVATSVGHVITAVGRGFTVTTADPVIEVATQVLLSLKATIE